MNSADCNFSSYLGGMNAPVLNLADRKVCAKNGIFIMGIINCTPDSFYEGSRVNCTEQAVETALKMVAAGADVLDLGAESTRPGAEYVSDEEQIARLIPVIKAIRAKSDCPISIDCRRLSVFKAAVEAGADILNDVSAFEDDENLAEFCALHNLPVILMHKRANPSQMMQNVQYTDVVAEVAQYLQARVDYSLSKGIKQDKIILDPGIGFAKNLGDNCKIVKNSFAFSLGGKYPVLIGASRKTCVGQITGKETENRLAGTLAIHMLAAQHGASWLRVHDVAETVDCMKMLKGIENDND